MDAVEYLKAKVKMTKGCGISCEVCPLSHNNNDIGKICSKLEQIYPEKAVEIVDKWVEEHPIKTRQSEFLKMFPHGDLDSNSILAICPRRIDISRHFPCDKLCEECRKKFWLEEVDE